MSTIEAKIAGLYIAFFDRAADQEGLEYWTQEAEILDEERAVKSLAEGFATHPQFTSLYEDLDNTEYVQAIYLNTLGQEGDSAGISYWSDLLESGLSRSDMVAEFVSAALDFDADDPQYTALSQSELESALERQKLLQNKVDISLYFVDSFGAETNLLPTTDPNDPVSLANDPAYTASIKVVEDITSDETTKENLLESIDLLKESDDPISVINTLDLLTPQNVISALDENAPVFISPSTANSLDENLPAGTVVYTAKATDENSIRYSLAQDQDADLFVIDPITGEVVLLESPDFESKNSYSFTVIATDTNGNSSSLNVGLAINDIDENIHPSPSYKISGLGEVSTVDTEWVDTLLSGSYWDESVITYSFNTEIPDDYYDYVDENGTRDILTDGWTELNDAQQSAMRSIFDDLEALLDVTFTEVDSAGMIALNIVDMDANVAGFSFYPGDYYSYEGDIFLSSQYNSNPDLFSLEVGEVGWNTMAHELGHALGLKHPFEGDERLPASLNDTNHSIMSYTDKDNYYLSFELIDNQWYSVTKYLGSDLYSLYDVDALQAIYGVNDTTAIGDDTYSLNFSDFEIKTIWDAGGTDTIDLSNTKGFDIIDLNPGTLNSADVYTVNEVITFYENEVDALNLQSDFVYNDVLKMYDDGLLYTGTNNLAIATGVIIENLKTGSGNDVVTDNLVDNEIATAAGNDKIYLGYGGYDYVDGGSGYDIVYLDLNKENVTLSLLKDGSYDIYAKDNSFEATLVGIESISFRDDIVIL